MCCTVRQCAFKKMILHIIICLSYIFVFPRDIKSGLCTTCYNQLLSAKKTFNQVAELPGKDQCCPFAPLFSANTDNSSSSNTSQNIALESPWLSLMMLLT